MSSSILSRLLPSSRQLLSRALPTTSAILEGGLRGAHVYRAPKWDFGADRSGEYQSEKILRAEANPEKWEHYNAVVWPPGYLDDNGQPLPGAVYHFRENVKYGATKFWPVCHLVDQMPVHEALQQLHFANRKGAVILAEVRAEQSLIIKGRRKHARVGRFGTVRYKYSNVFVRLQEGPSPGYKTRLPPPTGWDKADGYLQHLRDRDIKDPFI